MKSLYFFDFKFLFAAFLFSSEIVSKMHINLDHFVDFSSQLWYFDSWLSAIRTTFGQFAYFQAGSETFSKAPLFSSDFVYHTCSLFLCVCQQSLYHLGRIIIVEKDYRKTTAKGFFKSIIILRIQKIIDFFKKSLIFF